MRPAILLLLLLPSLGSGCIIVRSDLGNAVTDEASVARLQPGQSVWEAVAIMGPPEEWRSPNLSDTLRARNELIQRVAHERDLFDRTRLTWIRERREDDLFLFIPFVVFFGWIEEDHTTDRVVVLLDEQGRVEQVAVNRELVR
ncbi:MAG: hypothetical protein DRQ55_06620 [Planctomycetota bacterium]|nr:MAG: hypothetical protein DRQ55_06620 [Planctomycetota bacterium]